MLLAIENGDFPNVLYAKDDKRLFRNEREAGQLIEWIWNHNVEIHYCLVQFGDPRASDEQWFTQRMYHLFAGLERRRKEQEVFEHQRQNALNGFVNGGLPPYGYQRREVLVKGESGTPKKKLTWAINPKEAPAIKHAFEMHQKGKGIKLIAEELTKLGFRSRRGAPMNKLTVAEWFRNPYPFAGCVAWNTRDHKLKTKPRDQWVIVEGVYPAIICMNTANEVSNRAELRRLGKKGKRELRQPGKYLLTGLLKCSECGRNFIINSSVKLDQAYYICGTRSRQRNGCANKLHLEREKAEQLVFSDALEAMLQDGVIEEYYAKLMAETGKDTGRREAAIHQLTNEIKDIDNRVREYLKMIADKRLPRDQLTSLIEEEQARKTEIQDETNSLKEAVPTMLSEMQLVEFRQKFREAIKDEETKKAALNSVIKQVTVYPNATLNIEYIIKLAPLGYSATGNRTESRFHSWLYFLAWASVCAAAKRWVSRKAISQHTSQT